jgi:CAAX protease family protein
VFAVLLGNPTRRATPTGSLVLLPVINFVWTWMRLKSGSLWPCVVLHAAHNTFIQRFFEPLTVYNKKTSYVAGEFGATLGVMSILMAVYFWKRRDEVEPAKAVVTSAALP